MKIPDDCSRSEDMPDSLSRLSILLGDESVQKLRKSKVAIVGLGGVGSWAAEALARSGVGTIILVDGDSVAKSNLNRQLFSTIPELGIPKVEAAARRISTVSEHTFTITLHEFLTADNVNKLFTYEPEIVIDAIDRLDDKSALLRECVQRGVPVVSSMGAGGKDAVRRIRTSTLSSTEGCPLARKLRRMLKGTHIPDFVIAVYSSEPSQPPISIDGDYVIGSAVWVTGVFGFTLAGEAVRLLLES